MMAFLRTSTLILIALSGFTAFAHAQDILVATGRGLPPKRQINKAAARLMAVRAAVVDAQRTLLETLQGVAFEKNKTHAQGILRGAFQIGKPKFMPDGTVEVQMGIRVRVKQPLQQRPFRYIKKS